MSESVSVKKEPILDLADNPLTEEERAQLEEVRAVIQKKYQLSALSQCTICQGVSMWHTEDGFTCSSMCHDDLLKELKAKGCLSFSEVDEREGKFKTLIENLLGIIGDPEGNCGVITCMDHIQKMADTIAIAFTVGIEQELVSFLEEDTKKIIKKIKEITEEAEKLLK